MTAGNIFWLAVLIGCMIAFDIFLLRGRKYGFRALAERTNQLLEQGNTDVWLLYGRSGVGLDLPGNMASWWALLNTGFLAYTAGGQLIIEFPWWSKMRVFQVLPLPLADLRQATLLYNRTVYPAVVLGDKTFVALGRNARTEEEVKQSLSSVGSEESSALLDGFSTAVASASGTPGDPLQASRVPQAEPAPARPSVLRIIRGTFLFILLPCLLITAVLIVWAILSNQPTFR